MFVVFGQCVCPDVEKCSVCRNLENLMNGFGVLELETLKSERINWRLSFLPILLVTSIQRDVDQMKAVYCYCSVLGNCFKYILAFSCLSPENFPCLKID